ncbi:MAG: hypothetical protein V1893_03585 [Candidatus Omnitrophota bacterium]
MAQERQLTPEKQLLKLIEDPKAKDAGALGTHVIKHQSLSFLSLGAWLGRISFFKEKFKKGFKGDKYQVLDFKLVNNLLILFMVILGSYFIYNLYISVTLLKKMPNVKMQEGEITKQDADFSQRGIVNKSPTFYLEKVRERDIFKMFAKKSSVATVEKAATAAGPSSRIIEATQNLKLVGIAWSNDPDVIIEDTKTSKTYFVKRGQLIGEIKIEAIFKDKVVLSYSGEEVELK